MAAIDKLNRAKQRADNEFYTRYEDVKFFVENSLINDYLKGKIVYLPCDSELSQIYKYLVDNKEKLGIKEILHTSDNYYGHLDLYKRCDVVFTNPPFTGIKKWLKWLDSLNIKYISWFPMMGLYSWPEAVKYNKFICFATNGDGDGCDNESNEFTITNNGVICINERKKCMFINDEGKLKSVSIYIISNDIYFDNYKFIGAAFKKSFDEVKDKLFFVNDGYEVKSSPYIPYDYFEPIYIPITAYIGKQHMFEYCEATGVIGKDGKPRPRIKVKLKKDIL